MTCSTKKNSFYIKARSNDEFKIGAFERCGRHYEIITYEGETALIKCTKNK